MVISKLIDIIINLFLKQTSILSKSFFTANKILRNWYLFTAVWYRLQTTINLNNIIRVTMNSKKKINKQHEKRLNY